MYGAVAAILTGRRAMTFEGGPLKVRLVRQSCTSAVQASSSVTDLLAPVVLRKQRKVGGDKVGRRFEATTDFLSLSGGGL